MSKRRFILGWEELTDATRWIACIAPPRRARVALRGCFEKSFVAARLENNPERHVATNASNLTLEKNLLSFHGFV